MNDAPTWIQAISAIAQSLIALATLLLSWVLWRSSRSHARIEYARTVQESWNQLNSLFLTNPKIAAIADGVFGLPPPASDEARMKRYLAFFSLNILDATHLGQRAGLVDDAYHLEHMSDFLDSLLRDPEAIRLFPVGGFHSDFVAFCERRIAEMGAASARVHPQT